MKAIQWLGACMLMCFASNSISQDVFLVSEENEILILDLNDYSLHPLFTIDILEVGYITDIAYSPEGKLYAISGANLLLEIDVLTGAYSTIYQITTGGSYPGLVCSSDNQLFLSQFLSQDLYTYDLQTGIFEPIQGGVSTPGDFSFYKGHLVYPSNIELGVKAFDGNTITNVGCTAGQVFTFFNVFDSCEENQLYGIDEQNNLYSYTLESQGFEWMIQLDSSATIFGGCSTTEYLASDCPLSSLTTIDCSLSINNFANGSIEIVPNPTEGLIYLNASSAYFWNSVRLLDIYGRTVRSFPNCPSSIDLSTMSQGVYFLELTNNETNEGIRKKIIKE